MRPIQIRSTLVLLGTVVSVAACTSPRTAPPPAFTRDFDEVYCPGFTVVQEDIPVTSTGREEDIGGGHRIHFMPGAVPTATTYRVSAGPGVTPGADSKGQIRIEPSAGGVSEFRGDVFLEINVASCGVGPGDKDVVVVMDPAQGDAKPVGGRIFMDGAGQPRIRVLIPHLTLFSIAR